MLLGPYRLPATDPDAELASLIEPDGLARALSAHRRRASIGLACLVLGMFGLVRASLAAEDVVARHRFEATSTAEAIPARRAVEVEPLVLALDSPAMREEETSALFVRFPAERID